jgi:hypothetical protein
VAEVMYVHRDPELATCWFVVEEEGAGWRDCNDAIDFARLLKTRILYRLFCPTCGKVHESPPIREVEGAEEGAPALEGDSVVVYRWNDPRGYGGVDIYCPAGHRLSSEIKLPT